METTRLAAGIAVAWVLLASVSTTAMAAAQCTETVKVLAQPRDGLSLLEDQKGEFEALSGASFEIDYLNENDRRAKSRADASTVGKYNVYYIDEANVALFASSGWVGRCSTTIRPTRTMPISTPAARRWRPMTARCGLRRSPAAATFWSTARTCWRRPASSRRRTLEEFQAAVKALHRPDDGVYGVALRGGRGSGANVWRWMPYFKGFGGQWFDGYDAGVRRRGGQEGDRDLSRPVPVFGTRHADRQLGRIDQRLPVGPGGDAHRIDAAGRPGDRSQGLQGGRQGRLPAAADAAHRRRLRPWPGDRRQGQCRRRGQGLRRPVHRLGDLQGERAAPPRRRPVRRAQPHQRHEERRVRRRYGPDLGKALEETGAVTAVNFWQDAQWPDLGDRWGIILEELVTGTRTDIQGGLDELDAFAKELVAKRD